jgi:hypothetical protein
MLVFRMRGAFASKCSNVMPLGAPVRAPGAAPEA